MSNQENVYSINDELIDQEVQVPVKSNKIKYAIAIITGTVLIVAATVLLVGYFKYNWFKGDIYTLDVNINRAQYQGIYFSETKTINTEYSFTNGEHNKKKAYISTDFVVILNQKKKLGKHDFLYIASMIILNSKVKSDDVETELTSFNIFDKETINAFEKNANGTKYPMALFKFYENGTIAEIKLPDNMDKYNADNLVELIGNVIPKLTRNRTEDMSKGLDIKDKKNKKRRTIVESQAPRTYETFKGSRYSKLVERDIEDEQISNIRVESNAYFQTEDEDIEEDAFGIKDFLYNAHSEINTIKTQEEKETTEIAEKIAEKFNFIPSDKLIENILEEERKKDEEPVEIKDDEEQMGPLRKLGFNFNVDKTFNIKTIKFLGQTFTIKYRVAVQGGKAINQIIIDSNLGKATFGNNGITYTVAKTWSGRIQIFKFVFPPFPIISLGVYAGGSLSFSVYFTTVDQTTLRLFLSGSITATAEIKAGWDALLSFSAGAEGTLIAASGFASITKNVVTKNYSLSGGKIVCYVVARALGFKVWKKEYTLFKGWSVSG